MPYAAAFAFLLSGPYLYVPPVAEHYCVRNDPKSSFLCSGFARRLSDTKLPMPLTQSPTAAPTLPPTEPTLAPTRKPNAKATFAPTSAPTKEGERRRRLLSSGPMTHSSKSHNNVMPEVAIKNEGGRRRRLSSSPVRTPMTHMPFAGVCPYREPGAECTRPIINGYKPLANAARGVFQYGVVPTFDPKSGDLYIADRLYEGILRFAKLPPSAIDPTAPPAWEQEAQVVYHMTPKPDGWTNAAQRFAPSFYNETVMAVGVATGLCTASTVPGEICGRGKVLLLTRETTATSAPWTRSATAEEGNVFAAVDTATDPGYGGQVSAWPAFVDIDGDGAKDLVVGTAFGNVRAYKNPGLGWNSAQIWEELLGNDNPFIGIRSVAGIFGQALLGSVDFDQDGRDELMIGSRNAGGLRYFKPDAEGDGWTERFRGSGNPFGAMANLMSGAPATYDVDGDGYVDLVVGEWWGGIYVYLSSAAEVQPQWTAISGTADPFAELDFGHRAGEKGMVWPTFSDVDGDGTRELIVGTAGGALRVFWRVANITDPDVLLPYAWRNASDLDPTVASTAGRVAFAASLANVEEHLRLVFSKTHYYACPAFSEYPCDMTMPFVAPAIGDIDNDGDLDIVIGFAWNPVRIGLTPSSLDRVESESFPLLFFENINGGGAGGTASTSAPEFVEMAANDTRVAAITAISGQASHTGTCGISCSHHATTSMIFLPDGSGDILVRTTGNTGTGTSTSRRTYTLRDAAQPITYIAEDRGDVCIGGTSGGTIEAPKYCTSASTTEVCELSNGACVSAHSGAVYIANVHPAQRFKIADKSQSGAAAQWVETANPMMPGWVSHGTHRDMLNGVGNSGRHVAMTAFAVDTPLFTGLLGVIGVERGELHSIAIPSSGAAWPTPSSYTTTAYIDETASPIPMIAMRGSRSPVPAFFDATTLVVGGEEGILQLLRPASKCSIPLDSSGGGGGGCTHSFAGACPNPYLYAARCTCAPGYTGTFCDQCNVSYGVLKGFCRGCPAGRFFGGGKSNTPPKKWLNAGETNISTCEMCALNHYSPPLASSCERCPEGAVVVSEGASCEVCAEGFHRVDSKDADGQPKLSVCEACPESGATCTSGGLVWSEGVWAADGIVGAAQVASGSSKAHKCFNPECCALSTHKGKNSTHNGKNVIVCVTSKGYKGILCGECDADAGFVRTARTCSTCRDEWVSILIVALVATGVVAGVAYIVYEHSFDVPRGAHSPVVKKILLSHIQLLGVLGVFKARGTATFNEVMQKPAEVGGGAFTSLPAFGCLLGGAWQAYGVFAINMALPPLLLLVAAVLLLPTTLVLTRRQAARAAAGSDAGPKWRGKWGFPNIAAALCGHLRRAASAAELHEYVAPFSPGARFTGVGVFILFTLYPTLVGSIASMLNCVTIDSERRLIADLSIQCWEGAHIGFAAGAAVGLVVYALGVPVGVGLVLLFRRKRNRGGDGEEEGGEEGEGGEGEEEAADSLLKERGKCCICCERRLMNDYDDHDVRQRFGFLFSGYATDRGVVVIWESFVMARKLAVAAVATLVADPYLQILAALLIVVVSFGATAYVQPYERHVLNLLDSLGLFTLVVTQVLSIVYFYTAENAATMPYNIDPIILDAAVTALLVAANGAVLLAMIAVFTSENFGCTKRCGRRGATPLRVVGGRIPGYGRGEEDAGAVRVLAAVQRDAHKEAGKEEERSLPEGWVEHRQEGSEKPYFHNALSGETVWERPTADADAAATATRKAAALQHDAKGLLWAHPITQCAMRTPPQSKGNGTWAWPLASSLNGIFICHDDPVALLVLEGGIQDARPGERVRWMRGATRELGPVETVPLRHFGGWRPCACGDDSDGSEGGGLGGGEDVAQQLEGDGTDTERVNPMAQMMGKSSEGEMNTGLELVDRSRGASNSRVVVQARLRRPSSIRAAARV